MHKLWTPFVVKGGGVEREISLVLFIRVRWYAAQALGLVHFFPGLLSPAFKIDNVAEAISPDKRV